MRRGETFLNDDGLEQNVPFRSVQLGRFCSAGADHEITLSFILRPARLTRGIKRFGGSFDPAGYASRGPENNERRGPNSDAAHPFKILNASLMRGKISTTGAIFSATRALWCFHTIYILYTIFCRTGV